jgi:hypothetical protein
VTRKKGREERKRKMKCREKENGAGKIRSKNTDVK